MLYMPRITSRKNDAIHNVIFNTIKPYNYVTTMITTTNYNY